MLLFILIDIACIIGCIWLGSSIAGLETVDFWRCVTVMLIALPAMLIVQVLLLPFYLVPFLPMVLGSAVLFLGILIAAKIVLSCDWQPAAAIGLTVLIGHLGLSALLG